VGLAAGGLVAAVPGERLLQALNQLGPGWALVLPLGLTWLAIVALVALATAWPAWRASGRPIVGLLRGAEVTRPRGLRWRLGGEEGGGERRRRGARATSVGPFGLGVRLAFSRPARLGGTTLVLAVSTGVVALMLALASLLVELRDDPAALGKRYEVAAVLDPDRVDEVRDLPGVADAAARYEVEAANSFQLGATFRLIGFAGDHMAFEAPPLAEGRRLRTDAGGLSEAEIGVGTADALGLSVGGVLAAQLPDGQEARFRVVGVVRALENSGRVAYVDPGPLEGSADEPQVAVKVAEGASPGAVQAALLDLGAEPLEVGGAAPDEASFLAVLAALLRAVAAVNGLVCLYTLVQTLALTARERRGTIAVLRATGAGRGHVALLLGGVVAAAALPAVLVGLALERWVLGPLTADLAAGYADLELSAATVQALAVALGVALLAAAAAWWVARRTTAEPVVAGLREE
ncbi:MAG TPA: FtsX-like permease family protein, partial [Solirubrobacteraceae bacterium]|nr:FtsX-like permease family protein [Solirubrobacteraceae bacterium]